MWRYDKKDIVISGFEKGIGDSAEQGIMDMRNANIITAPNEASVNFATAAVTIPGTYTATNGTFNAAANTVTYTPGVVAIYNGTSMKFTASSGGVTQDVVYWAGNVTSNTFKLYTAPNSNDPGLLVDLTDNNVHVFSTITLGAMTQHTEDSINSYNFFQDANGRVWWYAVAGGGNGARLIHIGPLINDGSGNEGKELLTNAHGNGLVVWAGFGSSMFLFAFRDTAVDVFSVNFLVSTDTGANAWVVNDFASGIVITTTGSHQAIASQDGAIYFCNKNWVGSILATTTTFDPTNSATFTATGTALQLPSYDMATWLAELGTNLLVGGIRNYVYPWDRLSTSYAYPLIFAEPNIQKIISTNSSAYIFAGNRGRIYITNGSNVDLYRKFPDQISFLTDPYWIWGGAIYWRNQLYFGIQSLTNAGGSFDTSGGVWGIDLTSKALRGSTTLAGQGLQAGSVPVVAPNISTSTPAGGGYFAASTNGSTFGLELTSTTPYTDIDAGLQIDTDLIPVGTYFKADTQGQIQWKTSLPLVSGETVRIQQRPYLRSAWTTVGTTTGVIGTNQVSDAYTINFEKYQWLQLRIQAASTGSSPSYCRLTEVRITPS